MKGSRLVIAALAACGLAASASSADILYASTGGINGAGGGLIYRIDTVAQTAAQVGDTGFDRVGGLDFDAGGTLYCVAGGSAGPGTLMTFDLGSGLTSVIGSINGMQGVDAIAFDGAGTLWGGGWNGSNGDLVTIDPSTGDILTATGMSGSGNAFVAGLAFGPGGTLYGSRGNAGGRADDIVTIDTGSGVQTPLGAMEFVISDLAYGLSGTLYGSGTDGSLYSINPVTGEKTFLFHTGISQLSGLTSVIPAPGSISLLALGALACRRRRQG